MFADGSDDDRFDPEDSPADAALADRLAAQRPVPAPGFRGGLGRHLAEIDPGHGPRPERLALTATAYLAGGGLLLGLGALSCFGVL